jgi:hypothetical protein
MHDAVASAGGESRHLVVDGTGVGPPVVDLLRQEDLQSRLWPVTITGGDTERVADGYYRVPKRDLIVGLQVLMQQGGLQIAAGMNEGATLVKEIPEMRVKISRSGNEQFGGFRCEVLEKRFVSLHSCELSNRVKQRDRTARR